MKSYILLDGALTKCAIPLFCRKCCSISVCSELLHFLVNIYINSKGLKRLLEYYSCVETRNYDRYCFRFYEIRLKLKCSNVKSMASIYSVQDKNCIFYCFTR